MQTRGEGVKKSENFADVICTWPLMVNNFIILDMGRAMIALFIVAFFFMFVSFTTGIVGCWRTSPSNITSSAILMLLACKYH